MPKCTCWPKELNQKGFPRNIQYRTRPKGPFFRHCATFFKKKLFSPRKAPLHFFWSFPTECMLKNPKGSSLSVFLGIVRLSIFFHESSPNSPILGNFEVLLLFLSLGYGVDLGRSRLVHHFWANFGYVPQLPAIAHAGAPLDVE